MKIFTKEDIPAFIGLDIGRSQIKAVQLGKNNAGSVKLMAYGKKALTDGSDLDPILGTGHFVDSIRALLKSPSYGEFSGEQIVISIPSRHTHVGPGTEYSFTQLASQKLQASREELLINVFSPGGRETLAIAGVQNVIEPHIDAISKIKPVAGSDHEMTAAARAFGVAAHPTILVDIGHSQTNLGYFDSLLTSTKTIDIGTKSICDAVEDQLNITPSEAKELVFGFGLQPSSLQTKIREAIKPVMHKLIDGLSEYTNQHNNNQVIIYGGGACIPGICQHIKHNVDVRVAIGNPWATMDIYPLKPIPKSVRPMFATAVGLAMLGIG